MQYVRKENKLVITRVCFLKCLPTALTLSVFVVTKKYAYWELFYQRR